jgi:RNA polymerase sigma factor (sigma-70 family)
MQSASGLLRPVWRGAFRVRQPELGLHAAAPQAAPAQPTANGEPRLAMDARGGGTQAAHSAGSPIDAKRHDRAPLIANPAPGTPVDERMRAARFEERILPFLDDAYNFARWLTRDREDAEDVVQEAYLRALRFFNVDRNSNPRAWILSIVRNTFYTSVAKKRAHPEVLLTKALPEDDPDAGDEFELWDPDQDTPETALARKSEAEAIRALVERLPAAFRETLVLREMEEFSYQEIADITGVPIGTVMSRLARARGLLAAAWKRFEGKECGR